MLSTFDINLALSKHMSSVRNKVKEYPQKDEEKLTCDDEVQVPYWRILRNTEIKQPAKKRSKRVEKKLRVVK